MYRFIFRLIPFFVFAAHGYGQNPVIHNYTTENGLPSSECYDLIQDSHGFIWIATDRGVSRFDGYEFKTFTSNEGLVDNTVLNLYEDQKGRIWFLAISGNLCFYDKGIIYPYRYNDVLTADEKFIIRSFYCDMQDNLTIGTIKHGIIYISNKGEMTHENNQTNYYKYTVTKKDGELIYGSLKLDKVADYGLVFLESTLWPGRVFTQNTEGDLSNVNFSGIERKNGDILFYFPRCIYYSTPQSDSIFEGGEIILRMYEDQDSCLWISYNTGGVRRYEPGALFTSDTFDTFLENEQVTSILHDAEGGIWLATLSSGIYYMPSLQFHAFEMPDQYSITGLEKDVASDQVLVSFSNGILSRVNTNGILKNYNFNLDPQDSVNYIFSFATLNDTVFVSCPYANFILVENTVSRLKTGRFIRSAMAIGSDVIGSSNNSVIKFTPSKETSTIVSYFPIKSNNLFVDDTGKIWIGDYTGLYYLQDSTLIKAYPDNPLFTNRVSAIDQLNDTCLAVATIAKGLILMTKDNYLVIDEQNGIASNVINSMFIEDNEIWLGTNKGISHLVISQGKIRIENFTEEHGIPGTEISNIVKSGDLIWATTKKKIFYFNPGQIERNQTAPNIYIEKVLSAGIESGARSAEFSADEFPIRIHYTGLVFRERGNVLYKYRLKGLSDQWQTTYARFVEFYSLPPGNYQFEVMAANEDGIWSTAPAVYSFSIIPPFWRTGFFHVSLSAFLLLLVSLLFYIRIKYIRRKNKMTSDILNYRQQALAGQINPHFIDNSLNSIQALIMINDKRAASKYLSGFSRLMRKSLEHSRKEMVSLSDEIALISSYVTLEKLRFGDKFSFEINPVAEMDEKNILIPSMIVQPFIENAILHGINESDQKNLQLTVSFTLLGKLLRVSVTDTGIGIERSIERKKYKRVQKTSNGMAITTERLKMLCQNTGTPFYFQMTDASKLGSLRTGTIVEFNLPYKTEYYAAKSDDY